MWLNVVERGDDAAPRQHQRVPVECGPEGEQARASQAVEREERERQMVPGRTSRHVSRMQLRQISYILHGVYYLKDRKDRKSRP